MELNKFSGYVRIFYGFSEALDKLHKTIESKKEFSS
jgi:hypothetical protein